MFTGIISDIGEVVSRQQRASGRRFRIGTAYPADSIELGASIACAGCCLTVVASGGDPQADPRAPRPFWFDVEVSTESLAATTASTWREGTRLNLERALRLGEELGGHMVSGHVDGTATVIARADDADMAEFRFRVPAGLERFIAVKGSVALDGTSLTVNRVQGDCFSVMVIPHTQAVTTWGAAAVGDRVNLEVDLIARYVDRLNAAAAESSGRR